MELEAGRRARRSSSNCRAARWLDATIAWATRLAYREAWLLTLASVVAAGFIDRLSGTGVWIGPLYLLILCLPAWSLGWREALLTGVLCVGCSILANGTAGYPLGGAAVAWNLVMRLLSVAMIVTLMVGVRRSHDREWLRARTDGLTGALTRHAFLEQTAALRGSARSGILAYIDLDGFKQINDRHGHAAGDDLLRSFAAEVEANIRTTDAFARIGGDEFLIYMPTGDAIEGRALAELLHKRLNGLTLPHAVRCSMGVVLIKGMTRGIEESHVGLADRLMYEAKAEGGGLRLAAPEGAENGDGPEGGLAATSPPAAERSRHRALPFRRGSTKLSSPAWPAAPTRSDAGHSRSTHRASA